MNSDGLMCELLKFQYGRCDHIKQTQEVLPSAIGRRLTKRRAHAICRFNRKHADLHLCCPNQRHPLPQAEVLDTKDSSGHVRVGYIDDEYRTLIGPIRFQIECVVGIGTPAVCQADRGLRTIRNEFGDWAALPLLSIALSTVGLATFNQRIPFSLYTKAIKAGGAL